MEYTDPVSDLDYLVAYLMSDRQMSEKRRKQLINIANQENTCEKAAAHLNKDEAAKFVFFCAGQLKLKTDGIEGFWGATPHSIKVPKNRE